MTYHSVSLFHVDSKKMLNSSINYCDNLKLMVLLRVKLVKIMSSPLTMVDIVFIDYTGIFNVEHKFYT